MLALGIVGTLVGTVTHATFLSSTSNSGNTFASGTVYLSDNDSGTAMLSLTSAMPGTSDTSCIRVSYDGSLTSTVRLYAGVSGSLASYLNLTVTRGSASSPSFDSCTPSSAFTADSTNYFGNGAGVIYSGLLSNYPATYSAGIVDPADCGSPPCSAESWTTGEPHVYKFVITLPSGVSSSAQGQSATAIFTWEGQNS
jgi:hypothetical protein